jgi:hypothetical protein
LAPFSFGLRTNAMLPLPVPPIADNMNLIPMYFHLQPVPSLIWPILPTKQRIFFAASVLPNHSLLFHFR